MGVYIFDQPCSNAILVILEEIVASPPKNFLCGMIHVAAYKCYNMNVLFPKKTIGEPMAIGIIRLSLVQPLLYKSVFLIQTNHRLIMTMDRDNHHRNPH